MAVIRKFAFDTVFAPDGQVLRDGAGHRSQFTVDEVEAERKTAFEQGRRAETARAEQEAATVLKQIAEQTRALLSTLDETARALRRDALEIAMAAARKAADCALDAHGEARVIEAATQAMETLRHGPRLIVRLAPAHLENVKPRLEQIAEEIGYPGALIVRADERAAKGDVTLEWAEGLIMHDRAEAFSRIAEVMASALEDQTGSETQA